MSEELRPCPFCGRRPEQTHRAAQGYDSPTKKLFFVVCYCGGASARAHQFGYTAEEVAAKWNTRASDSKEGAE